MATEVKADAAKSEEQLLHGGKVMSLTEHLSELRTRVVRSLLAVLVFFCGIYAVNEHFILYLKGPLQNALPEGMNALHFTGPMDVFIAGLKVSFLGSVILACPVWLYQFWRFFEPAMYPKERRYVLPFVTVSVALFFSGVAFSFFVILPLALNFLIGLGLEVGQPIITITDYLSLIMILVFGFGLVFETPVILVLLAMLDIIDEKGLVEYRKLVMIGILVLSAIMTPPDPISQMAMAIPVYLMYEASIVIIRLMNKKKKEAA